MKDARYILIEIYIYFCFGYVKTHEIPNEVKMNIISRLYEFTCTLKGQEYLFTLEFHYAFITTFVIRK